jgi:endogenous inhibitor of DNA gyrase (YacG/DUF329 family)
MQGQSSAEWPHFPFCSRRCRLIDLGRWLGEDYRVPPEAEGEASMGQPGQEHDIP